MSCEKAAIARRRFIEYRNRGAVVISTIVIDSSSEVVKVPYIVSLLLRFINELILIFSNFFY